MADVLKVFDTMGTMVTNTRQGMVFTKTAPVDLRIETSVDGFTTLSLTYKNKTMILATLTDEIKAYLKEVI